MAKDIELATALREGLRDYGLGKFKQDAIAGFIVSLVALPLAMAIAIAVGLPPQHGIYTAIVAGIAAALFGGSLTQVSGPTAAFVVIVAPIVAQHGLRGLIWCQLIAGVVLILMGIAKFGKYISFVPYPVTTGFTAGIAVVLGTLALNDFLGLGLNLIEGDYLSKASKIISHLPGLNVYELFVGTVALLIMVFFGRVSKLIPSPIVGIGVGVGLVFVMEHFGVHIATIGSKFSYLQNGISVQGIPPFPPTLQIPGVGSDPLFAWLSFAEFKAILMPALVVAALAAIESLLSATVADSMAGTRHNPNAELNGIGIANILSGLAAGVPATGAIARTATNIQNGAKTPIAAIIHALMIMLYVLLLAPFISYIPMAALAALLLSTAYRMSHVHQFIRTLQIAPRSDVIVMLVCFALTVFIDMVAGVGVGIVLASLLFMQRVSELTQFELSSGSAREPHSKLPPLPEHVMIYTLHGPLFFASVEKAFDRYQFVHDHIQTLIIDMEDVPLIDMSGLVAMKTLLRSVEREGRDVIICGKEAVLQALKKKMSHETVPFHIQTHATLKETLAHLNIGV